MGGGASTQASAVLAWSVDDVCVFLEEIGLSEHIDAFREMLVDGEMLLEASAEEADGLIPDAEQQAALRAKLTAVLEDGNDPVAVAVRQRREQAEKEAAELAKAQAPRFCATCGETVVGETWHAACSAPTVDLEAVGRAQPLQPGQVVDGNYKIEAALTDTSYQASHASLGTHYVLHVASPALEGAELKQALTGMQRQAREGQAATHANLVAAFDFAQHEESGNAYLVLEQCVGQPVAVPDGDAQRVAEVGVAVLGALQALHEAGVTHGAVSRETVLLRDKGSVIKLSGVGTSSDAGTGSVAGDLLAVARLLRELAPPPTTATLEAVLERALGADPFASAADFAEPLRPPKPLELAVPAAEGPGMAEVAALLEAGEAAADPGEGRYADTALLVAASMGASLATEELLAAAAAADGDASRVVDQRAAEDDSTPLKVAAQHGHDGVVARLLYAGADVEAGTRDGRTALFCAADEGHASTVAMLLAGHAKPDPATGHGPLWAAAKRGRLNIVEALLEAGANPDRVNARGETAVWAATEAGHNAVVARLLDLGADESLADAALGTTPLYVAAQNGNEAAVERLLAHSDVNQPCNSGATALFVASANGHEAIMRRLLEARADVNVVDNTGKSPLLVAIKHPAVAPMLVEAGADVTQLDDLGQTAAWLAACNGEEALLASLLAAGSDANHTNRAGKNTLWIAARNNHVNIVKQLLAAGANVWQSVDNEGKDALEIATERGNKAMVKVLQAAGS